MTTYLDKEAVLKAFQERFKYPSYTFAEFIEQIEHGKFDAPQIPMGIDHLGLAKALADKDAEITRLNEKLGRGCPIDGYEGCPVMKERDKFRVRIAELEKLTVLQKETIDAQEKALREAREMAFDEVIRILDTANFHCYPHPDPDVGKSGNARFLRSKEIYGKINAIRKPAQKELELFICPEAGCMSLCRFCRHNTPHECDGLQDYRPCKGNCIPVKPPTPQPSPVPTSGTGTAPEGATVERARPGMLDDEHCVCDACISDSGIPSECGHDPEKCKTIALGHAYPGMAKDTGDLTLRVDLLEQKAQHIEAETHSLLNGHHTKRIDEVVTRMDNFESQTIQHDRRLEKHWIRILELETSLKALQEEIHKIKDNPILITYDPALLTFTTTPGIVPGQMSGSYNPCANCQTIKDLQQRYPNGYTGDSPCATCPNSPFKVTCSK